MLIGLNDYYPVDPVVMTIMVMTTAAIYLRRFYVKTQKFMENTVKRVKEMKRVTTFLVKKVDTIQGEDKDDLIQPMFTDLYPKSTKI